MRRPNQGKGSYRREPAVREWLIENGFTVVNRSHNRLGYKYEVEDHNGRRAITRFYREFDFKWIG